MNDHIEATGAHYDKNYRELGLRAERRYPNEELVRFVSRHYLKLGAEARAKTDILEVGSGPCGNLWMIAREGFRAQGLDISPEAIKLGSSVLASWGTSARLTLGSMLEMPYADASFDAVVDVLASFSLTTAQFPAYLKQVTRVLKPGGRFFLFTLSAGSDAFRNHAPAVKLDESTLNGIYRKDSPYYGCFYPHRFDEPGRLAGEIKTAGMTITGLELTSRTYRERTEYLECITVEAAKIRQHGDY